MVGDMELFVDKNDSVTKLELAGTIDASSIKELSEAIDDICENIETDVEVDMDKVDYIDSSGIGQLLKLSKICRDSNHVFSIVAVSERVKSLLALCSLQSALVE